MQNNTIDWPKIRKKLASKKTITEKLDFLKSFSTEVVKPLSEECENLKNIERSGKGLTVKQKKRCADIELILKDKNNKGEVGEFYGLWNLHTELGKEYQYVPEYLLWQVKHNAELFFNAMCEDPRLQQELNSPIALDFIEARLRKLKELDENASLLRRTGVIDIHNRNNRNNAQELELSRLQSGYYENNPCYFTEVAAHIYANHWLLKPYLEGELARLTAEQSPVAITENDQADTPIGPEPSELDLILAGENKFLKKVSMQAVYNHFKKLTDTDSDLGDPCLTEKQLYIFLRKGFLGESTLPKQEFSNPERRKGDIIRVFYWFYYNMREDGFNGKYTREEYIDLIFDCFDGWPRASIVEFFKPKTRKKKGK